MHKRNDERCVECDELGALKLSRNSKRAQCGESREAFMRSAVVAVLILIGGAAAALAQPGRPYEVYILDPVGDGPETYAFYAPGRVAALEARGCGDSTMISDAAAVLQQMRERRRRDHDSIIHIDGRGSRVELGWCGQDDEGEDGEEEIDDLDTLVVIDGLNATQMRRLVRSLDAASETTREDLLIRLGLQR